MFHVQILTRLSSLCMQTKVRSLDDLAALGPDALMALYASARTPALEELDGRLTGRMLTVPRAQEPHVRAWLEMKDGDQTGFIETGLESWRGRPHRDRPSEGVGRREELR